MSIMRSSKRIQRKSTSKPKNSVPTIPIQSQAKTQKINNQTCDVCFEKILQQDDYFECQKCHKFAHNLCYGLLNSDQQNESINRKQCDMCFANKKDARCAICSNSGLLRQIRNNKDNMVHISCALLNYNTISIINYKQMLFEELKDKIEDLKKFKVLPQKCSICKKKGVLYTKLVKCQICQTQAHVYCQKKHTNNKIRRCIWYQNYLIPYKNDNTQRDIQYLIEADDQYRLLSFIQKTNKADSVQVLCPKLQCENKFNYCYCSEENRKSLNEDQLQYVACDKCSRWVHFKCSKLKKIDDDDDFQCEPCGPGDKFKQRWAWKRIIKEMVGFQNDHSNKAAGVKNKLKFLHQMPFPFSKKIVENLRKSSEQVLKFELGNYCQNFLKRIDTQDRDLKQFFTPSMINLMYAISKHQKSVEKVKDISQEIKHSTIQKQFGKTLLLKKELKDSILEKFKQSVSKMNKIKIESQNRSGQSSMMKVASNSVGKKPLKQASQIDLLKVGRQKVEAFISKCQNNAGKINQNYAAILEQQLKDLNNIFQQISVSQNIKISQLGKENGLLFLLIQHNLTKQNILEALQLYKYLQDHKKNEEKAVDESIYYRTKKFLRKLDESMRGYFKSLFEQLIQKKDVKRKVNEKINFLSHCFDKLQGKSDVKHLDIQKMQTIAVKNNIYIPKNNFIKDVLENEYYYKILKQKCFQAIKKQFLKPRQIEKLNQLINQLVTKGKRFLEQSQIYQLQRFPMKFQFYNRIISKYRQACSGSYTEHIQDSNEMRDQSDQKNDIFEQVKSIFEGDKIINLAPQVLLNQFSQAYQNGVIFNAVQIQVFKNGLQIIFCAFNDHIQQKSLRIIKSEDLKKVNNVLKCFDLHEKFPIYQKEWKNYKNWVKPLEQLKISQCLEDEDENQKLEIVIEDMLESKDTLSIDLHEELKKLSTVKLWTKLSKKNFEIFCLKRRRRPTINAVQHFKQLLLGSKYPSNGVLTKIINLESQAKNLNNKINQFLERPKITDQDITEEQTFFYNKITIQYANKLLDSMKSCSLDVSSEMKQLQASIKDYKKISIQQFQKALKSQNLALIQQQKRKMMESPIRSNDQSVYSRMIRAIYSLKALEFCPPINRSEFKNMIAYGGVNATNLLKRVPKAQKLARAYKTIEKAQKQIILSPNARDQRKLLQLADAKRILEDLEADPQEKSKVQKWFETARLCRQKTDKMKTGKMETLDQLRRREQQLFRIPVNHKEITNEHSIMKRQFDQLIGRLRGPTFAVFIEQHSTITQFEAIYRKYKGNGIKDQKMQNFIRDYQQYKEIRRLKEGYKPQNYRNFSTMCLFNPDLARISQILQFRKEYFDTIHQYCSNQAQPFSAELNSVLIEQGVWIQKTMKINNKYTKSIVQKLVQLNRKKAQNFILDPQSEQSQGESELDDGQSDSDRNQFDEQGNDQDEYEEQSSDQLSRRLLQRNASKKRPTPCVDLDDQS